MLRELGFTKLAKVDTTHIARVIAAKKKMIDKLFKVDRDALKDLIKNKQRPLVESYKRST